MAGERGTAWESTGELVETGIQNCPWGWLCGGQRNRGILLLLYVWQFFALAPDQIYYLYQEYSHRYFQSVCVKNTLPLGLGLALFNCQPATHWVLIWLTFCVWAISLISWTLWEKMSPRYGLHYFLHTTNMEPKKDWTPKEFCQHVVRWKLFFPKQSLFEDNELITEVCGRGMSKNSDGPSHHSTLPLPRPALLDQGSMESALDECTLSSAPRYLMSFNPKKQNYCSIISWCRGSNIYLLVN